MKVKCIFLFFVYLTYTSFSFASDLDGVSELINLLKVAKRPKQLQESIDIYKNIQATQS